MKDSEDEEEENNTSPVKRPAGLMSGKKPPPVAASVCSRQSCLTFNISVKLLKSLKRSAELPFLLNVDDLFSS